MSAFNIVSTAREGTQNYRKRTSQKVIKSDVFLLGNSSYNSEKLCSCKILSGYLQKLVKLKVPSRKRVNKVLLLTLMTKLISSFISGKKKNVRNTKIICKHLEDKVKTKVCAKK